MSKSFFKFKLHNNQDGMTYIELIVVLSIMAMFTGIALFSYRDFDAKVKLRNVSNDIALKFVEAQKFALNGRQPSLTQQPDSNLTESWRPAYGIYLEPDNNNTLYFFIDRNQNHSLDLPLSPCPGNECMEIINLGNGNVIENISAVAYGGGETNITNDLSVTFTRPSSNAVFNSSSIANPNAVSHIKLTLQGANGAVSEILIYASGRIDIN